MTPPRLWRYPLVAVRRIRVQRIARVGVGLSITFHRGAELLRESLMGLAVGREAEAPRPRAPRALRLGALAHARAECLVVISIVEVAPNEVKGLL